MELDLGEQGVGRSKGRRDLSQQLGFSTVLGEIGEKRVKTDLHSPGPATPIQAAPVPQLKVREASTLSSGSAASAAMHCSDAAESSLGPPLASTALSFLPAASEDDAEKREEHGSVGAVGRGAGLPSARHGGGSLEDRTMADWRVGDEVRGAAKSIGDEPSMSRCGAMERSSCGRSVTSMGRPSWKVKVESPRATLDGGLCVASDGAGDWRSQERGGRESSGPAADGARCGDESGATLGANGREGEGAGVSGLSGGRGGSGAMEEWKGKRVEMSLGVGRHGEGEEGRADGRAEQSFRGVVEADVGTGGEHGAEGCRESSSERWTKRVKREVAESGMAAEEWRGQRWGTNEAEVRGGGGTDDIAKQQEQWRSVFVRSGGGGLVPQGHSEKAAVRGVDVGSAGCGEARTVVVKKTPKRVHNSDPSAMSRRPEFWMSEECAKSPRWSPHVMVSSAKKLGGNGGMVASDVGSGGRMRDGGESGRGAESGVELTRGVQDGRSGEQSQAEWRVERGPGCFPTSASRHVQWLSEPGLPLSLNFSAKPQRAAVSSCRTSTEEEWGKSLALCGPGGESAGEVQRSGEEAKAMSYEERFVELQSFLKKCDEDEQSDLLDALRSLSAAGRSSHAVVLEERALSLSIEEGKEMSRLKSLNVMGQRGSWRGRGETGCTPEGPRVACFGSGGEQLAKQTRSPGLQMQMQMLMSGSRGWAGFRESYYSG